MRETTSLRRLTTLLGSGLLLATSPLVAASKKQPNILFILTDDQDWHMRSLAHMPLLQKHLLNEGTLYANHFCTVALCCPSRVNLWTGRAAHNTNVTDVWPPYGGFPKVVREGINDDYLPVWMQNAGYNTYYSGKLWNGHNVDNYNAPMAGGYNGSDFVLDPFTYEYYNAHMSRNGGEPVSYKGQYSPDITAEKTYGFLEEALEGDRPWFITSAPIAPHGNIKLEGEGYDQKFESDMPRYAERHAHLFKDYKIPRDENFNPEEQGGVAWVAGLPRLNDSMIEYHDEYQRARLRSLQSVDEMVEKLVKRLDEAGQLDNTYIFYTTDNGYHLSQHRMSPGKECGFDTDIHIPLIVRGPGVAAGRMTEVVTAHTDLSPTIMRLAGQWRDDFDGVPIPLEDAETREDFVAAGDERTVTGEMKTKSRRMEHVNVEYWGMAIPEGLHGDYGSHVGTGIFARNNTYKGLRLISEEYSLYYSVWCTGDHELYDVKRDAGQQYNHLGSTAKDLKYLRQQAPFTLAGRPVEQITNRLDALVMVLKSCKGKECQEPWSVLHPSGNVATLTDALAKDFDDFYAGQPKVSFDSCELGYIREQEGPQEPNVFGEGMSPKVTPSTRKGFGVGDQRVLGGEEERESFKYRGPWTIWT